MRSHTTTRSLAALLWVLGIPFVVLVGMMSAVLPLQAAMAVLGITFVAIAFIAPPTWLLVGTLVFAALIGGSAEYFLGLAQANWIPFLLSMVLACRALLSADTTRARVKPRSAPTLANFLIFACIYIAIIFGSSISNLTPPAQILVSIKNYLLMWGVFLAFMLSPTLKNSGTLVWKWILTVAALQLPVTLYQKFFIASKLTNSGAGLSFDAINGTFGGGLLGGRSGALAMFICIAVAYALIQWRDKKWSTISIFAYLLITAPTLAIVEVKAVVFWLPGIVFLVFFAQISQRPLTFIVAIAGSALAALAILYVYRMNYGAGGNGESLIDAFIKQISYVYDPDRFNPETRELGRFSALTHWWRENSLSDSLQFLLGYGAGASRGVSSVAVGTVAAKYTFMLDISAAAALLWDTGLLGLIAFLAMLISGALKMKSLSKISGLPAELRRNLEVAYIALLLIASSVFYVRDTVDGPIIQFVMFFCLGHYFIAKAQMNDSAPSVTKPISNTISISGKSRFTGNSKKSN